MLPFAKLILLFLAITLAFSCSTTPSSFVTTIPSPASLESSEPFLATHNNIVYLSWIETQDTTSVFKYATLDGDNWSTPKTIASGTSWFVNWADYPTVAVNEGSFAAHYLDESGPGKYSYDAKYIMSADGNTWGTPMLLNEDGKDAEHGFVTIIPYRENFFITWLDGRNAAMEGMDHGGMHGAMSLRAAIVDKTGKKLNEWMLDDRTCDCCQTTAAITSNGPVVIYRDRSDDEIRDMSIVRWSINEWTKPASIYEDHWRINGCPVNGPRVSASENDLAVAWFSAPGDSTQVKVVFSNDGGVTFSKPVQLNRTQTSGRIDVELINEHDAAVSWLENDSLQVVLVSREGIKRSPIAVAPVSSSRASGFPQMTRAGSRLIFAWTDVGTKSVKTAAADL
jgi:hypothetical protein